MSLKLTQEEYSFLQKEANKIDCLQYFKIVINHILSPPNELTDAEKEELKAQTINSVSSIKLKVLRTFVYNPLLEGATNSDNSIAVDIVFNNNDDVNTNIEYFKSIGSILGNHIDYFKGIKLILGWQVTTLLERELQVFRENNKKGKRHTKIAIHTATQFFADSKQKTLFSEEGVNSFISNTGLSVNNKPSGYGIVLNQSQRRVLEAILKAFTETNYNGDEQQNKTSSFGNTYTNRTSSRQTLIDGENAPYKNINTIPVLKLTQAKIIELSGYDIKKQRQGDKQDVIEALSYLSTHQFCFYWLRAKMDKGRIVKDEKGNYVKEEVMEVGTILRVKTVRDTTGQLQYYEIHPSAVLLDQIDSYFLLVPNNWREEVKQITGTRASSYTYEFLFWLRVQYEQIRRYNNTGSKSRKSKPKPFIISKSWEEVAIALKMPETMYKANRKRAQKIVKDAYSVGIKIGYLKKIETNGVIDTLYLNEDYYPKTGALI